MCKRKLQKLEASKQQTCTIGSKAYKYVPHYSHVQWPILCKPHAVGSLSELVHTYNLYKTVYIVLIMYIYTEL